MGNLKYSKHGRLIKEESTLVQIQLDGDDWICPFGHVECARYLQRGFSDVDEVSLTLSSEGRDLMCGSNSKGSSK